MTHSVRFGALLLLSLLAGCGGGGAPEEPGPGEASAGGEAEEGAAPEVAWADMTREQRVEYMRETVVPAMRELFQAQDPERYADFGCPTCHGENAREVDFAMPNGLAPLNHAEIPSIFQSDEPMARLMTQQVWPRMAELLSEPPFDPETGEGFSCMRCHATAEGEGGEGG